MSFLRHPQIYPPIWSLICTGDGPLSGFAPGPHRLDESAAGYSLAGCAPAEPASASPDEYEYAVQSLCRSRSFHPTANIVLTVCVSSGGKRTRWFGHSRGPAATESAQVPRPRRDIISRLCGDNREGRCQPPRLPPHTVSTSAILPSRIARRPALGRRDARAETRIRLRHWRARPRRQLPPSSTRASGWSGRARAFHRGLRCTTGHRAVVCAPS
jgi:hypothetical protein